MFGDADTQSLISQDPKFDNPEDRMGFVRKVYSILAIQFLITVLICIIPLTNYSSAMWILNKYGLMIAAFVLIIIVECAILCVRQIARTPPYNYAALLLFTFCMGYVVAWVCATQVEYGREKLVYTAALVTLGMTLGLTVYSFVTSDDITYIIGFLFILVSVSFFVGIISIFKWNPFLHNFYIGIAVVIFGIFLLLDTKLLMGGKTYKLFVDDYIIAAMILYMDIIMIFLYLLRLLGGR